jgi:hypothetical protein
MTTTSLAQNDASSHVIDAEAQLGGFHDIKRIESMYVDRQATRTAAFLWCMLYYIKTRSAVTVDAAEGTSPAEEGSTHVGGPEAWGTRRQVKSARLTYAHRA